MPLSGAREYYYDEFASDDEGPALAEAVAETLIQIPNAPTTFRAAALALHGRPPEDNEEEALAEFAEDQLPENVVPVMLLAKTAITLGRKVPADGLVSLDSGVEDARDFLDVERDRYLMALAERADTGTVTPAPDANPDWLAETSAALAAHDFPHLHPNDAAQFRAAFIDRDTASPDEQTNYDRADAWRMHGGPGYGADLRDYAALFLLALAAHDSRCPHATYAHLLIKAEGAIRYADYLYRND